MNQNNEFLSGVLRQGARALAGYASRELLEKHPEAEKGFQPDPFAGWKNWLAVRLEELAAAISANRPRLFISQIQWGKAVLEARGISPDSFRDSLVSLQDVLSSELAEHLRPPAVKYIDLALEAFDEPTEYLSSRLVTDTDLGRLASAYLLALLEGDRRRSSRLVLDALDRGQDVRDLYLQVLLPAQQELGRMWLFGEINVAEEHFASQTTKSVMAQLLARAKLQPSNGKTMLAAAVAGNQHDIGLEAVADFFEMDGWKTISLGANVPTRDLVQAIDCFNVDLLGMSVSQITQFEAVKTAIQAVRDGLKGTNVKVLLGGGALADPGDLEKELGADGYAADAVGAVALGRQLVGLE